MDELVTKVLIICVGLGITGLGVALWSSFGAGLQAGLNVDHARLPGRFQYPAWWHRLFGALVIAFGVAVVTIALIFHLKAA